MKEISSDFLKRKQLDLYRSKEWIYLREQYAKSQDFLCERCGRVCWSKGDRGYKLAKARGQDVAFGIVHHKEHLNSTNINNPEIALGWGNLEYLCITCHNKEHIDAMHKSKKNRTPEIRKDVKFDSDGNIVI